MKVCGAGNESSARAKVLVPTVSAATKLAAFRIRCCLLRLVELPRLPTRIDTVEALNRDDVN